VVIQSVWIEGRGQVVGHVAGVRDPGQQVGVVIQNSGEPVQAVVG
jgi:hypothetical protein